VAFVRAEMPLSMMFSEKRYRAIIKTKKAKRVKVDQIADNRDALAINRASFLHIDIKIANRYHDMAGIP